MGDEAVKIFFNAKGTLDDVSDELKAFLDYVAGKKLKDACVERLEEAVKEAKKNREWRHEYMIQTNHKRGKWARQILDSRNGEGMWGDFHSLSQPTNKKELTTEQAIRRLRVLGFTKEDEAIQIVLERMCLCVSGRKKIDDHSEKTHDWPLFERLMLSAWIRLFEPENRIAMEVARQWAYIVEKAFSSGQYNKNDDIEAFYEQFGRKPKSGFETGFGMFYHVALLQGVLNSETEKLLLDYYISRTEGIYYVRVSQ